MLNKDDIYSHWFEVETYENDSHKNNIGYANILQVPFKFVIGKLSCCESEKRQLLIF